MSEEAEEQQEEEAQEGSQEEPQKEVEESSEAEDAGKEVDWRDSISDAKLKEHAGRFTSIEDVIRANLDSRQKLSKAIVKPGKDASEDEVAAYRKAMDIPDEKDGYELTLPDDAPEDQKASLEHWKGVFHENGVPKGLAAKLVEEVQKENEAVQKAQVEADKKHAEQMEEELKKEWGSDFEKNKTFGDRAISAMADRAGVDVEELRHMETKEGRFLLDDPRIVKLFSVIGREMGEGELGPVSGSDIDKIQDQIDGIRQQIKDAQDKGDSKKANQLYQKEQALLSKLGNKPVVGSQGRAA